MNTRRGTLFFLAFLFSIALFGCNTELSTTTLHSSTTSSSSTTTTTVTTTSSTTTTTKRQEIETFSLAALLADYNQLVRYISNHPKLYTDQTVTDALIISQRRLLTNGMTELDFFRVIMPIVASLNCMHTNIELTNAFYDRYFSSGLQWPIDVLVYDGELLVLWTNGEQDISIGDRITSINGRSVTELIDTMMKSLISDGSNTTRKAAILNQDFFFYHALFIDIASSLELEFIDSETNQSGTMTITLQDVPDFPNTIWPDPFSSRFESNYAVMSVSSFYPYGTTSRTDYFDFFDSFFQQVETEEIENIILDIRGNGGGDPMVTSRLFSYLAKTTQPYFSRASSYYPGLHLDIPMSEPHFNGNLYTLIDGLCGSSCGHFAALLKYQEVGIFLGEETGGSFSCTDSSTNYALTNTHLIFRSSTYVWTVVTEGLTPGRGILPDVSIINTFADDLANIDAVMQYSISLIENQTNP